MIKHGVLRCGAILLFCLALTALAQPAPAQEVGEKEFKDGVAALEAGDGAQAAALFTKAIELNPDWVEAYVNRGQAFVLQGQLDQALKDFTQALGLDPDSFEALYNRGRVYTMQGKPEKAVADYTAALKLKNDDWQVYYNRGNAYLDQEKFKEALADYDKALKLDPKNPQVVYNRGLARLGLGRPPWPWRISTRPWSSTPSSPGRSTTGAGPWNSWGASPRPGGLTAPSSRRPPPPRINRCWKGPWSASSR